MNDAPAGMRTAPTRRRGYRAGIVAVAAAVALAGAIGVRLILRHADPTHLRVLGPEGGGSAGAALQSVPLNVPYVYVIYPICVDHGAATITGVQAARPRGAIRVVDWAVATGRSDAGDGGFPGTASARPGYGHAPVTSRCDDSDTEWTSFAVSVAIASPNAVANGFLIHYRAGEHTGTAFEPFSVEECTGARCRLLAYNDPARK